MRLAAGLLCVLLAAAGTAAADDCHPAMDATLPQYTVGYGSLMETASKRRTAPNTGENLPVMLRGYERAWNTKGSEVGFSTTYLGVRPKAEAEMVAALYRVLRAADMDETDKREVFYCRERVPPTQLRMLDGSAVPGEAQGQIWIYVNKPDNVFPPSERFPIVQSYVDIFITGCLQLRELVDRENLDFAKACIATTAGWSTHWVNDRLYPRRPFIHQPRAGEIDRLLSDLVPEFKAIRIE